MPVLPTGRILGWGEGAEGLDKRIIIEIERGMEEFNNTSNLNCNKTLK
jgi:hypothetical protein